MAGRAEALPHCWRLPRRFPKQMGRSGSSHLGCVEWEHTAPSAAGCVAWEEGDVPWPELAAAEPEAWHGGNQGWGRLQTASQAVGTGDGSRAEVVMDSVHVP